MPKRTKKEKIIAEYRRKLQAVARNVTGEVPPKISPSREEQRASLAYQLTSIKTSPPIAETNVITVDASDLPAIRRDLVKTLVLAAATISMELLLYWRIGK